VLAKDDATDRCTALLWSRVALDFGSLVRDEAELGLLDPTAELGLDWRASVGEAAGLDSRFNAEAELGLDILASRVDPEAAVGRASLVNADAELGRVRLPFAWGEAGRCSVEPAEEVALLAEGGLDEPALAGRRRAFDGEVAAESGTELLDGAVKTCIGKVVAEDGRTRGRLSPLANGGYRLSTARSSASHGS